MAQAILCSKVFSWKWNHSDLFAQWQRCTWSLHPGSLLEPASPKAWSISLKTPVVEIEPAFCGFPQLEFPRMNKHVKWCKTPKKLDWKDLHWYFLHVSTAKLENHGNLHGPWHCRQASAFYVTAGSAWGRVQRAAWSHRGRRPLMGIKKPMTRLGKMGECHI